MLCLNCGSDFGGNTGKFCTKCGTAKNATASPNIGGMSLYPLGKLLTYGSGKDLVKSRSWFWIFSVLFAVGLIVLGVSLANHFGYTIVGTGRFRAEVRTGLYYVFLLSFIAGAVYLICYNIMQDVCAAKTEIFVYENGIKGAGGGQKFAKTLVDTILTFHLEYDRIASVDTARKNMLSINAYGRVYTVIVANPNEIVDTINERLRQIKSAVTT